MTTPETAYTEIERLVKSFKDMTRGNPQAEVDAVREIHFPMEEKNINKETILHEFEKWQAEFYGTTHALYRNGNKPKGDLAFSTWQRRFLAYLEINFPNKVEEYNKFVHPRYVATVTNIFQTPLENFMSTKGRRFKFEVQQRDRRILQKVT